MLPLVCIENKTMLYKVLQVLSSPLWVYEIRGENNNHSPTLNVCSFKNIEVALSLIEYRCLQQLLFSAIGRI
jgi:hypothetical protein